MGRITMIKSTTKGNNTAKKVHRLGVALASLNSKMTILMIETITTLSVPFPMPPTNPS